MRPLQHADLAPMLVSFAPVLVCMRVHHWASVAKWHMCNQHLTLCTYSSASSLPMWSSNASIAACWSCTNVGVCFFHAISQSARHRGNVAKWNVYNQHLPLWLWAKRKACCCGFEMLPCRYAEFACGIRSAPMRTCGMLTIRATLRCVICKNPHLSLRLAKREAGWHGFFIL